MNTQDDQFCADCFDFLVQVFTKGISLFEDAAGFLKRLRLRFTNSDLSYQCADKLLSNIEELLKYERGVFEVSFVKFAYDIQETSLLIYIHPFLDTTLLPTNRKTSRTCLTRLKP